MIKNKIILYDDRKKIAEYDFDGYDIDSIANAETQSAQKIKSYFQETGIQRIIVMKYDENGDTIMTTIDNPCCFEKVYIFNLMGDNVVKTIAAFDSKEMARAKLFDWFLYHHNEFEKDEIAEIIDELISSNEFSIDDKLYTFNGVVINQC